MKICALSLLLLSFCCAVFAQVEITNAPQWQVTLRVIDENGIPVAGANVFASYYIKPPPDATEAGSRKTGITDTNGIAILTAHSGPAIGCGASKEGYYSTTGPGYNFDFRNKTNDQWHPWNPTLTLVLKKSGKPIAMYAKFITFIKFPVLNKPVGYDLMAGDWVAPYGNGVNTDFFFSENHAEAMSGYTFAVSFPNNGDGIQEFSAPALLQDASTGQSDLRSLHEAPAVGYQSQYAQTQGPDLNRNYYFRVRTVLDSDGNIKSALYGKIYGDLMQFKYYLNPTPNDRNIEFDPKQNLLRGLQSFEQVSAP